MHASKTNAHFNHINMEHKSVTLFYTKGSPAHKEYEIICSVM